MFIQRQAFLGLLLGLAAFSAPIVRRQQKPPDTTTKVPILVELFTAEGCSSCPPADALLQTLDAQPIANEEIVVLGEHVDYWDHQGWRDAYSSSTFTNRQKLYQESLHFGEVYTPQMIVDGTQQFNGSDGPKLASVLKADSESKKTSVKIDAVSVDGKTVSAHITAGALDAVPNGHTLSVYAVLALNHAETDVNGGENAHKHLTHTAVARSITKVASSKSGQGLEKDIKLKINFPADPKNLRLVVFLQDETSMKVYGTAMRPIV